MRASRSTVLAAAVSAAALALTGCAGGAGGGSAGSGGGGEGFEYGASQEEVDKVLADLEPVTLTYQSSAASPDSIMAPAAVGYKELIEKRSGGKITVDIIWGQAVAGYSEVDDALADGRLDLAYSLPIYNPADYPTFDALAKSLSGVPNSPMTGEAIMSAVSADVGWGTPKLLEEYEAQGLVPLTPMVASGGYYTVCTQPGTTPDDMKGRQIRVASTYADEVMSALGASPVSMEYVEVFEALQRGTVDCTLAQLLPSAESGILEVAPYIGYASDDAAFAARSVGAELAGRSYNDLPLAYQQIIADAGVASQIGVNTITANGNAESVRQAKAAGGGAFEFDPATEELIIEENQLMRKEAAETGLIGDDAESRIESSIEKWTAKAAELGLEDGGSIEDMDEWWTDGEVDFTDFATAVYEEAYLDHRPS